MPAQSCFLGGRTRHVHVQLGKAALAESEMWGGGWLSGLGVGVGWEIGITTRASRPTSWGWRSVREARNWPVGLPDGAFRWGAEKPGRASEADWRAFIIPWSHETFDLSCWWVEQVRCLCIEVESGNHHFNFDLLTKNFQLNIILFIRPWWS